MALGIGMPVTVPRPIGLDWLAVEATARMAGILITPEIFHDLKAIEAGAIEAFREVDRP